MKHTLKLSALLADGDELGRLEVFALLSLGVVESLINGAMTSDDAIAVFFHAQNCLFVRKHVRNDVADEVMSRGVQLHDLFEALSEQEAQQEFQRELRKMSSLCLQLLDHAQQTAA